MPWLRSTSLGAATPEILVVLSRARASRADRAERVERFEEDRCRRADVGIMLTPPYEEEDWRFEYGSGRFWVLAVKRSDVEDVVEATEAV